MTDLYSRQSQIAGWNQQRLATAVVAVVGGDYAGVFAVVALLLLGVREVRWIGRRPPEVAALADVLLPQADSRTLRMLPHPEDVEYAEELDWLLGPSVDVLLVCAEDRGAHIACRQVVAHRDISAVWASARTDGGWFAAGAKSSAGGSTPRQHPALALAAAAVLVDAMRQALLAPAELAPPEGLLPPVPAAPVVPPRIAQIGVGGIGTWSALLALLLGVEELILVDHDQVEVSNLNRSVLYTHAHARSGVPKAEAAAAVLQQVAPAARITTDGRPAELPGFAARLAGWAPDAVLSALDNADARLVVSAAAHQVGIPLIQGGTDTWLADVHVQGRHGDLLDDQMLGMLGRSARLEADQRTPGCSGSYVAPQMAAAALMGLRLVSVGGPGGDRAQPPLRWRAGGLPYQAAGN
jgi:molybdopterin/thiamine biosynthesis adenylyltransferase